MKKPTFPLLLLLSASSLHAQSNSVPHLINYQGRIATDGVNFDGTGQFKFALVDGASGQAYWTSSADTSPQDGVPDAAISLPVRMGLYSITLGDTSLASMAAIPATVFTHPDVRLRVWFSDGGAHGWEQFSPDQRIAAVGYAMMAESVPDGAITAGKIATGAVTSSALAAGSVTNTALAAGSVKLSQLDLTSVTPAALGAETPAGSQAKIDATIAATLGNAGGMAALKTILSQGRSSAGIQIISDSTNYNGAWSKMLVSSIGQLFPAYSVRTTEWVPNGTQWASPVLLQQGTADADARHWEFPAGAAYSPLGLPQDFPMPSGNLDLRAKIRITNNSTTANMIFSKADNGGRLGFRLWQGAASQNRALFLDYSTDGNSFENVSSTAGLGANGLTDGSIYWVRVTLTYNSSPAGKIFTFYSSTDGATWTQLGNPVTTTTSGSTLLAGGNANCYLGGWGGVVNFTGSIYAAEIRNGIDGPTTHPLNCEAWNFNGGSAVIKGAPDLWVSNAAWPGASADSFNSTPTLNYCRNYSPQIIFISISHNNPGENYSSFINKIKTLVTSVRSVYGDIPKIIFLTQNPQLRIPSDFDPNNSFQDTLSTHRALFMSWANGAGYGVIDTWSAFINDPRPLETLVGTNTWYYTPITSLTSNGTTATANIANIVDIAPADVSKVAIIGVTTPTGAASPFNGAYPITGKSGNSSGPGTVSFPSTATGSVVLTNAFAARSDGIHPSVAGNQLWADTILAAFKRGTP